MVPTGVTVYQSDGHAGQVYYNGSGVYHYDMFLTEGNGLTIDHAEDSFLCGEAGSSGSPIWTHDSWYGSSGKEWITGGGVVAASNDTRDCGQVGAIAIVTWSSLKYDLQALNATLIAGDPS